jgi:NAD(P)-dependent dehydrogenase (short-subunit alcohol dehydrogenase family)
VDALDERAVDKHLQSVIDKAGRVDISFNAVGIPDTEILGVPLIELDVEQFSLPIKTYATSYFLTARLAARRMVANKSGVIMRVTALHSRAGIPLVGGYGPAMAAMEALTRGLSAELAPQGIRVVGLRPQAMPETSTIKEAFEPRAEAPGLNLGTVAGAPREQGPRAAAHDARGDGERGGVHGFRQGKRDDGSDRESDHGQPGRLTPNIRHRRQPWPPGRGRVLKAAPEPSEPPVRRAVRLGGRDAEHGVAVSRKRCSGGGRAGRAVRPRERVAIHLHGPTGGGPPDPKNADAGFVAFAPTSRPLVAVGLILVGAGAGRARRVPIAHRVLQRRWGAEAAPAGGNLSC